MPIDPVLLLLDELRNANAALKVALYFGGNESRLHQITSMEALCIQVANIRRALSVTPPTSALGAGELVNLAAEYLPLSQSNVTKSLRQIGQRLATGNRSHTDLVRLRALLVEAENGGGVCATRSPEIASLLRLAIKGAAAPILIFRAIDLPPLAKASCVGR